MNDSRRLTPTILPVYLLYNKIESTPAKFDFVSVEVIATENLVDVQFKSLRKSIHTLQRASKLLWVKKGTRLRKISER